jgi:hypothetical protein
VVYPNPVTGNEIHIYVDATIQQQLYFQIINEYGALMLNASIPNNFILNISNIPSGAYFYKVLTASGQKLKSGVLVITH